MRSGVLFWLVAAIAAITLVTGCIQILFPAPILAVLSAEQSPTALHFFGLVGMFMALFGGALLHGLFAHRPNPVVVLWAGLQKFGAVAGVGIGVLHGIFAPLALGVTVFDLVSGVLILAYLPHVRSLGRR